MKTCSRCREEKPREAFHRNRAQPDGLQYYCKTCHTDAQRESRRRHPGKHAAYMRDRRRRVGRVPEPRLKKNARARIAKAVLRGKIEKPKACPRCGRDDLVIEAHHEDYAKPMEIDWLCSGCHGLVTAGRVE